MRVAILCAAFAVVLSRLDRDCVNPEAFYIYGISGYNKILLRRLLCSVVSERGRNGGSQDWSIFRHVILTRFECCHSVWL